ncbi:MAG: hypothetical protein JWQ59_2182 [Cryobacterium sp.]|jgi:hypothetical protein|nr:hypothetical protein [Cryobacterium sp.]
MKAVPVWLLYTVYRILMFAVPLAILLMLRIEPWLATLIAAIIGFCLSYIFLRAPREKVAVELYAATHRSKPVPPPDDATEDAAIDDAERRRAAPATAAHESEGERRSEEDGVRQPGETGEFQGKNQLS